ncbi:MAG: S8 family peptidase [Acidobacteriota bacterium]|nr:S8 family peptidase [Acidobacteriota bacterium]
MFADDVHENRLDSRLAAEHESGSIIQRRALRNAFQDKSVAKGFAQSALPFLDGAFLDKHSTLDPNAYLQYSQWRSQHPTADGRGVTIAILDGIADLSHPALQGALDLGGNSIPKLTGVLIPESQIDERRVRYSAAHQDDGLVRFESEQGGATTSSCPQSQRTGHRVGIWIMKRSMNDIAFCVEWSDLDMEALIVPLHAKSFQNALHLFEVNHKGSFARLLISDPKKHMAYDEDGDFALIYCVLEDGLPHIEIADDSHSTMVATAAAGTSIIDSHFTGVAPAARVLYVRQDTNLISELISSVWHAANRKDVDVICITTDISDSLDDAQPITPLFIDRISLQAGKPIIVAAGNEGPGLETNRRSGKVFLSIGAYNPSAMIPYFTFDSAQSIWPDVVSPYSSSGPNANGMWGTTLVTPALGITGWTCSDLSFHPPSSRVMGTIRRIPGCWASSDGTSVAAARAAGAVALIISALKQAQHSVSPQELRQAVINGAEVLPDEPAYLQGAGVLQLASTWNALQHGTTRTRIHIHANARVVQPLHTTVGRISAGDSSVYITRDVPPGTSVSAYILASSNKPLSKCSFSSSSNDADLIIATLKVNDSHSLLARATLTASQPGIRSDILELHCANSSFPIFKFPFTVLSAFPVASLAHGMTISIPHGARLPEIFFFASDDSNSLLKAINLDSGVQNITRVNIGVDDLALPFGSGLDHSVSFDLLKGDVVILPFRSRLVSLEIQSYDHDLTLNDGPSISLNLDLGKAAAEYPVDKASASRLGVHESKVLHFRSIPSTPLQESKFCTDNYVSAATLSLYGSSLLEISLFSLNPENRGLWFRLDVKKSGAEIALPELPKGCWAIYGYGSRKIKASLIVASSNHSGQR